MIVTLRILRKLAAAKLAQEKPGQTLQATALVHEVYLKLLHQKKAGWADRSHFYAFAAKLMRMILIDHAREAQTQKRGGPAEHVPLSADLAWIDIAGPEMLELNRALDELAELDPLKVQLIELRYFLGCTAEEAGEIAQVSKATVDRDLKFARGWLYRRLQPQAGPAAAV